MKSFNSDTRPRTVQSGFTIIELMIALLIGVFLMGGLLTLVQDNKRTFVSQSQLAQLQDSERMALAIMTDVIQEAGYFPDPTTNSATSTMPVVGTTFAAGQAMTGTHNTAAPGDTISVRYATASGDGILNCAGQSNATPGIASYTNTFSVVVTAGVGQLVCTLNGLQYPLINGVTNLQVMYGINTSGTGNNVDTYMTATQVTTNTAWNNVISVRIALTFNNPLYTAAGLGQPATIQLKKHITVMNQIGL